MNIYKLALHCLLMALPLSVAAQRTITGRITDAETQEPLPFVAVALKGTTSGTISDIDGKFSLKLSESVASGNIEVSCVGYKPLTRSLTSIGSDNRVDFVLQATVSEINEVAISAKSMLPQNIMRKAISNISTNYVQGPLNYDIEYSDEHTTGKTKRSRTAWVQYFDKTGYKRASASENLKHINYRFVSTKTNFTPRTLSDYMTNIDELLMFDIVRQAGNILDGERLGEFDIKVDNSTVLNGDSVWVVSFVCNSPGLLTLGDWNASSASGTLLVGKQDNAVLKYTVEVKTRLQNEVSQSLAVDTAARATSSLNVVYTVETTYEKNNGAYVLKQIRYSNPADKQTSTLNVVSVKSNAVIPVEGREYLAKAPAPKKK